MLTVTIISGGWYGYSEYNRKPIDLSISKADLQLSTSELISSFENNVQESNKKYLDKILAVSGVVKSVEKNDQGFYFVVLSERGNMSSVRCSMDETHQQAAVLLTENTQVTIKGVCTGFNSDELLGSDVILNRCVVMK